jgi:putative MATE family efflux protein
MFPDRKFLRAFFVIALPVALQNFFIASLGIVDTMLVGQLGETPIAAIGLANNIYFILTLVLFGVTSGTAIFVSQFWGQKDIVNIHRTQGLSLSLGVGSAFLLALIAVFLPHQVLSLYTNDPVVIDSGAEYLRVVGLSYIPVACTLCYASVLIRVGHVRLTVTVAIIFLCTSTLLNYGLILGHFGLPALGVRGAAIAACVARWFECLTLLSITYLRKLPPAASLRRLFDIPASFFRRYFQVGAVVLLNEILWAIGFTVITGIYAHISTEAIAAVNIARALQNLALVMNWGSITACAVLVGKIIGEGDNEKAHQYGTWSLLTGALISVATGLLMIVVAPLLLGIYRVPPETKALAFSLVVVMGLSLWLRTLDGITIVGVLRSGGDTVFSSFLDTISIWVGGVLVCYIAGVTLGLPVIWVQIVSIAESLIKIGFGFPRIASKTWITNLALR